jgi:tetratricopeptide (TPR) repeat protein
MTSRPVLLQWFAIACFAVMALSGCHSMDRAEAVSEMNKGLEALEGGRTLDAVRHLKEASTIDLEFAEPPYYLGQIYHRKLSEPDSAEQNYREAMSRDESNAQFAYQLGTILQEQNKHADAIAYLKKATDAKPDFAKAWFRLGLSLDFEKDYSAAIDAYSKSIHANARMRMDKEDKGGAAYHALGDLYNRFGFYDHALKVYSNALENNPDVPRLLSGEGVAQLKLKRFPEAEASFTKALEIDPSQTTAIFNRGVAFMAEGATEKAVQGFEEFVSRADSERDEARIVAAQGFIQQIREKAKEN